MSGEIIRARNKIKRQIAEIENYYFPDQVSHPYDMGIVKGLEIALSLLPKIDEGLFKEIYLLTYQGSSNGVRS